MTYDYSTVRKKGYSFSPIHDHRIQSGFSIFIWTGQIKKLQKLQKKFTKVSYILSHEKVTKVFMMAETLHVHPH